MLAKTFDIRAARPSKRLFQIIISRRAAAESGPYIVTTANQLAAIGGLGKNQYAALGNDIK